MKNLVLLLLVLGFGKMKSEGSLPLAASSYTRDPARTPKNVNRADPVNTVDGSTGKYRNKHKHPNGKNWARRKKHADTVKPRKNREKKKEKSDPKGDS